MMLILCIIFIAIAILFAIISYYKGQSISDEVNKKSIADFFQTNFNTVLDLPAEREYSEIADSGELIRHSKMRLQQKELGIFDELRIHYFSKAKSYKISFVGKPPVGRELDAFIRYVVSKYGADDRNAGILNSEDYSEINNQTSWLGRMWIERNGYSFSLWYDEDTDLLELFFHTWEGGPKWRPEIKEYKIVGINFKKLPPEAITTFEGGWLDVEENNKYDKHAVAIYNDKGVALGYIGRDENEDLFQKIKNSDERILISGYVEEFETDDNEHKLSGKVFLQ